MKITKKELFKFCDENNDAINELQSQSDSTDFLLAVLIQQLKDSGVINEISPEPQPQLKQLDQSVFKEWADCWKFFATDEDGDAWRYREKPKIDNGDNRWSSSNTAPLLIGTGYDASNWQNSLIERDITKELLEIDLSSELTGSELCRAMLARGDKYVMCGVSDVSDLDAASNEYDDLISDAVTDFDNKDGLFGTASMRWIYAVPINNQGEPLTAAEAGL